MYTKFQWHRPFDSDSEKKDFKWLLPYMGIVAIFSMWPPLLRQIFGSLGSWRLHIQFSFS